MKGIKLFVFLVLLVSIFSAFVSAEQCTEAEELKADQLNTRYDFYYFRAEVLRLRMESVISEIEGDTTALESIKDDFVANYDVAKEAADAGDQDGFHEAVKTGQGYVIDFKKEANSSITNKSAIIQALNETMQENEEYLEGIRQDAIDNQLSHRLDIYMQAVCHAKDFVDKKNITNETVNALITALEEGYDDVEALLTEASETCGLKRLAQCDDLIANETIDAIEDFKNETKELRKAIKSAMKVMMATIVQARVQNITKGYQQAIDSAEELIAKAEAAGLNVTEVEELLTLAVDNFEAAQEAQEAGETEEAKEFMEATKENLKEIKDLLKSMQAELGAKKGPGLANANKSTGPKTGDGPGTVASSDDGNGSNEGDDE